MVILAPINLQIRKDIPKRFKQLAKSGYPQERFAVLLGHDAGTSVEIVDLYVPENVPKTHFTKYGFDVKPEWWFEAYEKSKEEGLSIVGDIHSHCFGLEECQGPVKLEPTPSEIDLDNGLLHISAICLVTQGPTKRLRTRIRWWGPQIEIRESYV